MDRYAYTSPISEALAAEFRVAFPLTNTGGGCMCLESSTLEGNVYILVGSGVDGPLWTEAERGEFYSQRGHFDGFGVGIYDADTGYGCALAEDQRAVTGADVVALAKRALSMVSRATDDDYPGWHRAYDGTETERRWLR